MAALCTTQSFNPRVDLPMSTSSCLRTRTPRIHVYTREKASFSPPHLSCPLGPGASLNKRPIIHPDLNNRHSPTIVSFPRESPLVRRAGLRIDASITYVRTRPRRYDYSSRLVSLSPAYSISRSFSRRRVMFIAPNIISSVTSVLDNGAT